MQESKGANWYALPVGEVLGRLGTTPDGLPDAEVRRRLTQFGRNELRREKKRSSIIAFLNQFRSPLIYILLIAAVLSFASSHIVDGAVILAVVILNSIMGFFQESRAEEALESLRQLSALQATVIRQGEEEDVDSAGLVPGDVIMLETGDKVPADGRLFVAVNLKVDEAALTGESVPADKDTEPVSEDTPLAERRDMVFSGTTVAYGRGLAVVTDTGMTTQIGRIAEQVAEEPHALTPVQRKLARLGAHLGVAGLAVAGFVVGAGLLRKMSVYEVFFLGVAAAVSFIPEGLPAVVTVVMAVGVQRMARRNAVIRKLPAVETLGSATVICTDKTGTLTKNELTVQEGYTPQTTFTVTGQGYSPEGAVLVRGTEISSGDHPDVELLMTAMVLCNDARVHYEEDEQTWRVIGDPTEGALVVAGDKLGLRKHDLEGEQPRLSEVPFDSDKRYMATLHRRPDGSRVIYVKGAPERLVAMSDRYYRIDGPREITSDARAEFAGFDAEMAAGALRVLAAAYKEMPPETSEIESADVESGLTFLGAVGMMDPPREEAKEAIRQAKEAGIRVIMITGDHMDTARTIAERLGLLDEGGRAVPGRALDAMTDEQLQRAVRSITVVARAEPEHKIRIVRALRSRGQIVAMTGDGVNDAPALKLADIGISMGRTGTDVAKEASDMVLADDNFATIVAAIEQGRSIYANIRRVVIYLVATNSGEILIYVTTLLAGLPIPLLPAQILWINLVTDGFCTVPLALEPKEVGVLKRPPRNPREPVITGHMAFRIAYFALFMLAGTFGLYSWELGNAGLARARTYAFVVMAVYQVFNALNVRSSRHSIFKIGFFSNPYILIGAGASVVAQVIAVQVPFFEFAFRTVPLSLGEWVALILGTSVILWAEELRKALWGHFRGNG